jgi:hypothetical protein
MTKMMHDGELKKFTEDQQHCIRMLGDWAHGFHHLPMPKECGRGVSIHWSQDLSTWDFNRLTLLVLLAHERCVRIEISRGGPLGITIMAHRRKLEAKSICEGHPGLSHLVRQIYPHPADMAEAAIQRLNAWTAHYFPPGTEVLVNCERYRGNGVVVGEEHRPLVLPVKISNGNVWHYPVKACRRAYPPSDRFLVEWGVGEPMPVGGTLETP